MELEIEALGRSLAAAGARLAQHGLIVGAEGNLSVRLPGDRLLVTPTGRRKDELRPSDLVVVALAPVDAATPNDRDAPRPTSDIAIHRAIYAARPDVAAIVHAHVPAAMALTVAGEVPDPTALPETAFLLPRLPFVPFGAMGSQELADRIAAALAEGPEPLPRAALLERHGAVAVGSGPPADALVQAVDRMDLVDVLCRVWRDAKLLELARPVQRRPNLRRDR
jgi:L-fuculose-phosphate aldolase